MITGKERVFKILAVTAGVLGTLYVLSPFVAIIMLAAVVALALKPVVKKIRSWKYFGTRSGAYLLATGFFFLITIPFLTVLYKVYSLILNLDLGGAGKNNISESLNQYKDQAAEFLNSNMARMGFHTTFDFDSILKDGAQKVLAGVVSASTYVVTQIPDFLLSFAVFIVTLYLLLRHSSTIYRKFNSLKVMSQEDRHRIVRILQEVSYSSVFSSVITGLLQATIVSVGAMVFMSHMDFVLIFIITFLCSFIPVIGAAPIAFALAGFAWIKEGPGPTFGMAAVGVVAGTADNILRVFLTKVVRDELHPFISLLAIIGGVIVLGLPGLFLGPVIVGVTFELVPLLVGQEEPKKSASTREL